jgi:hypothetical protein
VCHETKIPVASKQKTKQNKKQPTHRQNTNWTPNMKKRHKNKIHHNFKLEATILIPDVAKALPYHKTCIGKEPVFTSEHKFKA